MITLNFTKDRSKISIIAPCFNEESNIFELCDRTINSMDRANLNFELILVDDGSLDSTWEKIQNMAKTYKNVIPIKNKTNLGIFYSWHKALKESTGDFVCLIDSDLQNAPEDIPRLYEKFHASNTTIVQGYRSSIEWDRDGRYISSRGLNFILNKVFKDNAKDNKSGFLLLPKSILEEILEFEKKYHYPHTFIRVSARSKGYSVAEIETLFLPRRSGSSFLEGMNFVIIYIRVMVDILRALREFGRGQNSLPNTGLDKYGVHTRSEYGYSGLRRLIFDFYFFTLPLHSWLITKSTKRIYGILKKTQWLPVEEIRDLQDQRLRRLIWHAYSNVPYYQKLFLKHGINPSDINTSKDLVKIPLLNKSDVSENLYMELFSIKHKKKDMHKIATSGSTGQPFVTYADREQLEFRFATTLRCLEWTGWRIGDRQIRLWHQKLGMSKKQVIKEKFDAFLLRRKFIPAFELTEESLKKLVKKLNKYKPNLIDGYAESLNFLALYLNQGGRLDFRPKGLMSSAQMLTTQTKLQIEKALGAKVLDKYGAREFSGIAYQCQSSKNHHIMDESYVVEILKDGQPAQPGELGEVVITDLNNFSVPLIRYRIGDLAVQVDNSLQCKCGRGLSQIGEIHGRTQALVFCSNERWLPGTFFAHFFKDYENLVRFYQIIQEVKGQFELRIVKGPLWNEDSWNTLIIHLREFVGATKIKVVYQNNIPLLETGKRSPVISKIKIDFQNLR